MEKSKDVNPQGSIGFDIGDKVEFLSQGIGIRGYWFKHIVIRKQPHNLKFRYEDTQNDNWRS